MVTFHEQTLIKNGRIYSIHFKKIRFSQRSHRVGNLLIAHNKHLNLVLFVAGFYLGLFIRRCTRAYNHGENMVIDEAVVNTVNTANAEDAHSADTPILRWVPPTSEWVSGSV
jgi:hypothetical protein